MAMSTVSTKNATGTTVTFPVHTDAAGNKISVSSRDTSMATYMAARSLSAAELAATPTDVVVIGGSSTKTVRVKSIRLDGVATTGVNVPIYIQKHSTANTGGTPGTAVDLVPLDSSDSAASATVTWYTANPTVGTAKTIGVKSLCCAAATLQPGVVEWDFCREAEHAVVLRGTAEQVAINFAASSFDQTGFVGNWQVIWEEESES